ncbi:SGNH/GDSL hydrolase family protein [Enterococcus casseliflavus]|uniref:SGNH/GDSL hydrolase family protein n=1 Tax=Enterococcus casseliflavus TaxID=37734 RepID=UPI003D0BF7DA
MPIQPVSGEIKAQPLNDNFSYLESEKADASLVASLGTGLGGAVDSLAQLKAQYPSGAEGFWITRDDGHFYIWKSNSWSDMGVFQEAQLGIESVDLEQTNFSKIASKNLFNKATAMIGALNSTGAVVSNANFITSNYIIVKPGQSIKTSANMQSYAFYNADKGFISGDTSAGTNTTTVPANCSYIRVTFYYTNMATFMLATGELPTEYEAFKREIKEEAIGSVPGEKITEKSISKNQTTFILSGKNKANPENKVLGKYVNPATGNLETNAAYNTYHKLPVDEYGEYTFTSLRFAAFYNKDGENLSAFGINESANPAPYSASIPSEAAFFSVSFKVEYDTIYQIELGDVETSYQPFGVMIENLTIARSAVFDDEAENDDVINLPSKIYLPVGERITLYKQNMSFRKLNYFNTTNYNETVGEGNYNLSVKAYDNSSFLKEIQTTITAKKKRTTAVKVLIIGDSIVRSLIGDTIGNLPNELKKILGSNIDLLGMMTGMNGVHFEGRGGWTAAKYRTGDSYEGVINPFFNPTTDDFDFNYYLTQNNIEVPDVIVLNLGTNDVFSFKDDANLKSALINTVENLRFIVNDVQSASPTTKVAINLTIPPTENLAKWQESYGDFSTNYQEQWRYKLNNIAWVKTLINEFSDCDLIPVHLAIDAANHIADGVHPNAKGYELIAKMISYYLNTL